MVQNRIRFENGEITENAIPLTRKPCVLRSRASKIGPQTGPKLVPNRIFDAEALRKPLESLLERSWRPQEPKKRSWERLLAGLGPKRVPKLGSKIGPQTALRCLLEPKRRQEAAGEQYLINFRAIWTPFGLDFQRFFCGTQACGTASSSIAKQRSGKAALGRPLARMRQLGNKNQSVSAFIN